MNLSKIILATIIIWIFGALFTMTTSGFLFNWIYEIPPVIWKPSSEILSLGNIVSSYLGSLVVSFIFVSAYAVFFDGIPGKTGIEKGMIYGFLVWLIGSFSDMIIMPSYMTIASTVIVYWMAQGVLLNLVIGAIAGTIYKK